MLSFSLTITYYLHTSGKSYVRIIGLRNITSTHHRSQESPAIRGKFYVSLQCSFTDSLVLPEMNAGKIDSIPSRIWIDHIKLELQDFETDKINQGCRKIVLGPLS
jgi:hypothetical protein